MMTVKRLASVALALLLLCSNSSLKTAVAREPRLNEAETEILIRTSSVKINVDDMEKALSFYRDKLGFEIEDRSGYPTRVILKTNERNKLILNRVKRLKNLGPTDTKLSFTLQVNDLDRAIERLKSLGVEFAETEKRKEGVGNAISILDPFGRRISLMHQTIVKVEPFTEPKLYNFGFLVPDMAAAREFYSNALGFVARSEKYLPLDLPLGHKDKSFAFMLHYRPGVQSVKSEDPKGAAFNTLVFETDNLKAAMIELKKKGVRFLGGKQRRGSEGESVAFEDPFGNVSELLEVMK
jgi:catechol 2,3-dioxygenase-like lactoylglutathione lyase family enzyme